MVKTDVTSETMFIVCDVYMGQSDQDGILLLSASLFDCVYGVSCFFSVDPIDMRFQGFHFRFWMPQIERFSKISKFENL